MRCCDSLANVHLVGSCSFPSPSFIACILSGKSALRSWKRRQVGCSLRSWVISAGRLKEGRRALFGIRVKIAEAARFDGAGGIRRETAARTPILEVRENGEGRGRGWWLPDWS